jgi:hypothetical protein
MDSVTRPYCLVVEGKTDRVFFEAFLAHHGLGDVIDVRSHVNEKGEEMGGYKTLAPVAKTIYDLNIPRQTLRSLVVVRDADDDYWASFADICQRLEDFGLPRPQAPLMPVQGPPALSVLMIPTRPGQGRMLEDLLFATVKNNAAAKCIQDFVDCVQGSGLIMPPEPEKFKLTRYGLLIGNKELFPPEDFFDFDSPLLEDLRAFLSALA